MRVPFQQNFGWSLETLSFRSRGVKVRTAVPDHNSFGFLVYCKVDAQGLSSFPAPSFYVRGDVDNASFVCPSAGAYIGRDVVGRFRLS